MLPSVYFVTIVETNNQIFQIHEIFMRRCHSDNIENEAPPGSSVNSRRVIQKFPRFNREPALIDSSIVLLSGMVERRSSVGSTADHCGVFVELHVPQHLKFTFISPVYFALYTDSERNELVDVIVISDGMHKAVIERSADLEILIGSQSFIFRTPEECKLWYVLVCDVKAASTGRLKELLDLKYGRAPRGYRTQFAELERSLTSLDSTHRGSPPRDRDDPSLLFDALSCIDYLSSRLEHCRCSNNVSLEMEDTVYETRAKISQLITNRS